MGRGDSPIYCATPALKFVLDGEERYEVDGRIRVVRPGEFLLVEAGTRLRAILPRRDCTVGLCIYLRQDEWAPYVALAGDDDGADERTGGRVMVLSASGTGLGRHLQSTGRILAAEPSRGDSMAETICRTASHHLHSALADVRRGLAAIDAASGVTRRDLYSRLDRARAFLHDNPHRQVPLDELAGIASLSQFHLLRSYKAAFGAPPAAYHRRLRLDKAAAELVEGGRPPDSIGRLYGFGDIRSFRRAFVGRFGCPPKAYAQGRR
ncbi:MAG TPA: AraC family transcriptional regulator [Allosphingosinicella sp.]|jgi:AraC-like DNA-binding protein